MLKKPLSRLNLNILMLSIHEQKRNWKVSPRLKRIKVAKKTHKWKKKNIKTTQGKNV